MPGASRTKRTGLLGSLESGWRRGSRPRRRRRGGSSALLTTRRGRRLRVLAQRSNAPRSPRHSNALQVHQKRPPAGVRIDRVKEIHARSPTSTGDARLLLGAEDCSPSSTATAGDMGQNLRLRSRNRECIMIGVRKVNIDTTCAWLTGAIRKHLAEKQGQLRPAQFLKKTPLMSASARRYDAFGAAGRPARSRRSSTLEKCRSATTRAFSTQGQTDRRLAGIGC